MSTAPHAPAGTLDSLDFHDGVLIAAIRNRDRRLTPERNAHPFQFKRKARHINRLEQPRSQLLVHGYGQTDDPFGEIMMRKREYFSAVLSGSPPFSA